MAMKLLALALIALAAGAAADISDYDLDEGVLVLGEKDFDAAIAEFDPLLVEFYAPWCGHCKRLAPEYAKAAEALAQEDPPLYVAKVDATAERSLGDKYDVKGFPTLKFFRGGSASEYGGGRTEKDIINWVKKKSGPATTALGDADAAKKFSESSDVVVIGFFADADSDAAKAFSKVASANDDSPFGVVTDASVAESLDAKLDQIVLFKDFDEKRNDYDGDLTDIDTIKGFVAGNSLPLVIPFSQEMAPKIFGGDIKTHFIVFADSDSDGFEPLKEQFSATATEHRGKLLAITCGLDNPRVMEYFGVSEDDLPAAVIVDMPANGAMKKYQFDHDSLTTDNMNDFAGRYLAGELKPFLKTEEPPESNDEPVKVVVGKTFEEIALDDSKDVLLEFYAPWCGHCKALSPKYDELATKLEGVDHIVIAKMDSTANEIDHPDVEVRGFPTLKFFPANGGSVMDYDDEREVDAFIKFLKKHSSQEFTLDGDDDEEL